jgi:hypothetical protein
VPVRAVPGAGGGRCRVFARKAKKKSARKVCFPDTKPNVTSSIGLRNATKKTTNTRFLVDSEHLPPDFTVKFRNFRPAPSNKEQIKYTAVCEIGTEPQLDYFDNFTVWQGTDYLIKSFK